jgi:hypothetical protein
MKRVFLGGTCNNSMWRSELIKDLGIDYFQPMSKEWTLEMIEAEKRERLQCDFCLYVITPKMTGVYSIAELVDDSNKFPEKTIFCYLLSDGDEKFTPAQIKSLEQTGNLIRKNGARQFSTLKEIATYLNSH